MRAVLRKFEPSDSHGLFAMYATFEPKGEFQGLPPRDFAQIEHWLRQLSEKEFEQFVIGVEGRIVGHAVLCPYQSGDEAELAIFLHQDYRGLGLGKKLLLGALNYGCKQLHLHFVTLVTQGAHARALRLFERVGFQPTGGGDPLQWEIEMRRASRCVECKAERCAIYSETLPQTVIIPDRKRRAA